MPWLRVVALQGGRWDAAPPGMPPEFGVEALENGCVLLLPALGFAVEPGERAVFSPSIAGAKNVSYDPSTGRLGGATAHQHLVKGMIERFSRSAATLTAALLPHYGPHLQRARASFRPVEIAGRVTSWRHDDTRLHLDAFPSSPVQGRRILRVFSNVNPDGRPRVWRVGEPFADVVRRFGPALKMPMPGLAAALRLLGITKTRRSPYDMMMLQLHDAMKADTPYQTEADQETIEFPAGSTWIAFTDQVSHAAMAGQYQLEQTFILPVEAMREAGQSPLRLLESMTQTRLA